MSVSYRPYTPADKEVCMALFDANCPEYFAPNEREDYDIFLVSKSSSYELCIDNDVVVGALGLTKESAKHCRIEWIMLNPDAQGGGIGSNMMSRALDQARNAAVELILIATSHRACDFFERFGAHAVSETHNGWGDGMHRIDMELRV